ncbi:uncharacterized protein LOC135080350 [Ostrinia nubilalis]|uniref:uncharacterized protein LOC135080350 n=1 Tax=Ostrinia nubilalis TaxID=29057 RepID=UPI0030822217
MNVISFLVLLTTFVSITRSSTYSEVKDNILTFLQRSIAGTKDEVPNLDYKKERKKDLQDAKTAQLKAKMLKNVKKTKEKDEPVIHQMKDQNIGRQRFHMDPVLNFLSRRSSSKNKGKDKSVSSSSSVELQDWKDEWKEHWIQKKFDAINSSAPRGDTVNMLAARPWGVPCGDPNQHDMPWGSCMLPMECESEYRIYRGDYFCGRTQFVCCALQLTTYDMYQGFDVSFADSSLATDSEEKRNREMGSKERRRKKKAREKRRRRRQRLKRKRQIKRNIRKIIKEIKRILNRAYRNGTTERKRKTKQLKKFIKSLKKQYKKDRYAVKNIHEYELLKIDEELQKKLKQIMGLNKDFISNSTFRDIIVNGTVTKEGVRMLVEAYPELRPIIDRTRRNNYEDRPDYLEYDIEYGLLYY